MFLPCCGSSLYQRLDYFKAAREARAKEEALITARLLQAIERPFVSVN
jgi:hypothetical protein